MLRIVLIWLWLWLAGAAAAAPDIWRTDWPGTDFARTSIADWSEIVSGGPGRDGIPAIDAPRFLAVGDARLAPREPVVTLAPAGARARAYPLRYLLWHEIVNDTVAGRPVAVTYCPLCNSAQVFDRRVRGQVLSFGVTGLLRHSDMVMYDRETESWWQQATGTGIVGDMTGVALTSVPAWMESLAAFRAAHPDGLVMAAPPHDRAYGRTPYRGYDSADRPFLYSGAPPPHGIPPLERVIRVGDRAWPMTRLARAGRIREAGLELVWTDSQASALDTARIGEGRDVGAIRVRDGRGRDVVHDVLFAFAFDAFWPDGRWMLGR